MKLGKPMKKSFEVVLVAHSKNSGKKTDEFAKFGLG